MVSQEHEGLGPALEQGRQGGIEKQIARVYIIFVADAIGAGVACGCAVLDVAKRRLPSTAGVARERDVSCQKARYSP